MSESKVLWTRFKEKMGAIGLFTRIETMTGRGIPDIYYVLHEYLLFKGSGWIELKYIPEPPVREFTAVNYKYRDGQVDFLLRHWNHGVGAFVFAQVGREYFLHTAELADKGAGSTMPIGELRNSAVFAFKQPWTGDNTDELAWSLTKTQENTK